MAFVAAACVLSTHTMATAIYAMISRSVRALTKASASLFLSSSHYTNQTVTCAYYVRRLAGLALAIIIASLSTYFCLFIVVWSSSLSWGFLDTSTHDNRLGMAQATLMCRRLLMCSALLSMSLIMKNQTTNEDLKKVYQNKLNVYDRVRCTIATLSKYLRMMLCLYSQGVKNNCIEFCCSSRRGSKVVMTENIEELALVPPTVSIRGPPITSD